MPFNSTILLLGIYPKDIVARMHKARCTSYSLQHYLPKQKIINRPYMTIHGGVWNKAQGIQAPGHYLDEGEVEWVTSSGCTLYLVLLKRRVQNGYYILLFLCKHIYLFSLRKSRRISQKLLKCNLWVRGREVRFFLFYILICNHANVLQHQKIDKSHLSKLRTKF